MGMREEMLAHTEFNTIHVRTAFRIATARENELLAEKAVIINERDQLVSALEGLVNCITETRGPDARKALEVATDLLSKVKE